MTLRIKGRGDRLASVLGDAVIASFTLVLKVKSHFYCSLLKGKDVSESINVVQNYCPPKRYILNSELQEHCAKGHLQL